MVKCETSDCQPVEHFNLHWKSNWNESFSLQNSHFQIELKVERWNLKSSIERWIHIDYNWIRIESSNLQLKVQIFNWKFKSSIETWIELESSNLQLKLEISIEFSFQVGHYCFLDNWNLAPWRWQIYDLTRRCPLINIHAFCWYLLDFERKIRPQEFFCRAFKSLASPPNDSEFYALSFWIAEI